MKHLLLTLLLASAPALPSWAGNDALAAQELADHLGIRSWVSKFDLQGTSLDLRLLHVRDGKVVATIVTSRADASDREFTRVAIEANETPNGTKVSVQTATEPNHQFEYTQPILHRTTSFLPATISEGDYVLGGEYTSEATSEDKSAYAIADVKDGLVLRVAKRP